MPALFKGFWKNLSDWPPTLPVWPWFTLGAATVLWYVYLLVYVY
jgi:hypothetical protein